MRLFLHLNWSANLCKGILSYGDNAARAILDRSQKMLPLDLLF